MQPTILKNHPNFSILTIFLVFVYGLISLLGPKFINFRVINLFLSILDAFFAALAYQFLRSDNGLFICLAGIAINAFYNGLFAGVGLSLLVTLEYILIAHFSLSLNSTIYVKVLNLNFASVLVCVFGLKIRNSFNLFSLEKEESKNRFHCLQASSRAIKEISGELELEKLLILIVQKVTELTRSPAGGIIVHDEDRVLRLKVAKGIPKRRIGQEINPEIDLPGMTLIDKKTVSKNNEEGFIAGEPLDLNNFKNAIISPVLSKGELLGAIFLLNGQNSHPFTKDNQFILEILCEHAAISIGNAMLFNNISKASLDDYLTGVGNIRFFYQQLRSNLAVAARYFQPCSLMIVDSDCFNEINDQYGNAEGFRYIRILAEILKDTVRSSDLVARFDRDMFMVILPQTDLEESIIIGKKIQARVNETPFIHDINSIYSSVCIGIATYPTDAPNLQALIDSVEAALYKARQVGKNTLTIARTFKN